MRQATEKRFEVVRADPDDTPVERAGWREGKPLEDPDKTKRWGFITAKPSEYLVHMRRGRLLEKSSGQGASCFKWPSDSVALVPTTIQRLSFRADQITQEKVGVQVTGLAVYRVAAPLIAFRMLNFSYPERASQKLEELLVEMFVGAARRLVANLALEECLTRRKEGIAAELMREIAPIVGGSGQPGDDTDRGWGVVIDTIEIQEVRIASQSVFEHLQAPFREERERQAREAELAKKRAVERQSSEVERELALARLEATAEVARRQERESERARLEQVAIESRASRAQLDAELALEQARAEAAAQRHAARLAAERQEEELLRAQQDVAASRRTLAEAQVALAELEARRELASQSAALEHARATKAIENTVAPEAIQLAVAQSIPQLAAAFQQRMGTVHVTAIDGANPFGYVAAAVEGVMGMARAAGLKLPVAEERE